MTVPRENFINLINIFWYLTVSHCRVVALSFVALTLKIVPSPAHDLRLTCDHNFRVYKHIYKYFEPFLAKIKKIFFSFTWMRCISIKSKLSILKPAFNQGFIYPIPIFPSNISKHKISIQNMALLFYFLYAKLNIFYLQAKTLPVPRKDDNKTRKINTWTRENFALKRTGLKKFQQSIMTWKNHLGDTHKFFHPALTPGGSKNVIFLFA